MGLKDFIRPLLPPTSRAFLNQTNRLLEKSDETTGLLRSMNERLRSLSDQVSDLTRENIRMQARLNALENQNRQLTDQLRTTVSRKLRYTNLEYASKLAGRTEPDILLAGWYGAENFGDELMLSALIESFPEDALSRLAVLLWDNYTYPSDFMIPSQVTTLHYPTSTWELDQLADHFDTLVWGGGAIIDDAQYTGDPDNYNTGNLFIRLTKGMLARGKRVYCLGLSTNESLSDPEYIRELDNIVSGCDFFSLRDPNSLETLSRAGIATSQKGGKRIELCHDLAFASSALRALPKHVSRTEKETARIALVPLSTPPLREHYVKVLEELTTWRPDTSPYEVTLVPFLNDAAGHDTRYCARLLESLAEPNRVHIADFARTPEDLHLEAYDLVISYKYHAALIALSQGTPTLCVCDETHPHYRNKMSHLASLFSCENSLLPASSFAASVRPSVEGALRETSAPSDCGEVMSFQGAWLRGVCQRIVSR